MDEATKKKIGNVWTGNRGTTRRRWWASPRIVRYVNELICGEPLDGWNAGPLRLVEQHFSGGFGSALSIGSGAATKEIALVQQKIVDHFDIYELSAERIAEAQRKVQELGLDEHFHFYHEDYFATDPHEKYDFVFFDNALHHMLNTDIAVRTTYENLNSNGCFFCNDFIGASRFQWSDLELFIVNGIRSQLPHFLFKYGEILIKRYIYRPTIETMLELDPSEAADSASIIPAVKKYIHDPLIIHTGGLVYNLACSDILLTIRDDSQLLGQLLDFDRQTIAHGFQHYAFILGKK